MSALDAIADPARLRMVRHLAEHGPANLATLAGAAGVHVNTARPDLVALVEAGTVQRETSAPVGRGRPSVHYRLADGWSPPTTDFRGLAELLAAVVLRAGQDEEAIRALGAEWGRFLLGRPGAPHVERELPAALERLGFEAEVSGQELRLSACPCPLVLPDRPELICELTIAVAEGLLAGSGSGLRVGRRHHDPARRSCAARLRRGSPKAAVR